MDNGLIFPYPLDASMLNLGMLTTRTCVLETSVEGMWASVGPELVVGKRWGDAGR